MNEIVKVGWESRSQKLFWINGVYFRHTGNTENLFCAFALLRGTRLLPVQRRRHLLHFFHCPHT